MSTVAHYPAFASPAEGRTIPWYICTGVVAVTSSSIGGAWDVSWHRSIGRIRSGRRAHGHLRLRCAGGHHLRWLIVITFGHDPELWCLGECFWTPCSAGYLFAAWGCVAVLTSAPFDNWWHNAYGLDVKIVSPPHVLLILGLRGVSTGVMFLILAAMNRAAQSRPRPTFKRLQLLFLYVGGLAIVGQMFFMQEYTWDVKLHQASAYIALGIGLPVFFATISQASRSRWAATSTAAVYTLFIIAEILILPLFPAQPKLGPLFNPVTHLIPAKFPILILVPALALDLLWHRFEELETVADCTGLGNRFYRRAYGSRMAFCQLPAL